jgi:predicted CXXCH cytochrome family protein
MRTRKTLLLLVSMLLLGAGVAWASGGIVGTVHDFTTTGASLGQTPDFTAHDSNVGLCTYCHTPHNAGTNRLIWNHQLPGTTYSWSGVTQTIGGTQLPSIPSAWQGPSKFCLSCHDGTVEVGYVYWFNEAANQHLNTNTMTLSHKMATAGSLNGNHPVAVPYPFGGVANTYNGVITGSGVLLSGFYNDPTGGGIRLFNDDGTGNHNITAGPVALQTGMECSSCHDPHNGPTAGPDKFLRGTLGGSDANYICLKCHNK